MELTLNLVWVMVAAIALAYWPLTWSRAKTANHRLAPQLLALSVLLLILLPAISITDDLWSVRNPAETDILVRRHDEATHHFSSPSQGQTAVLIGTSEPPDTRDLGYATLPVQTLPFHHAPARLGLFIRPPPVL
ncbi:MAG: hypothetical protein ACLGSD_00985 [Acidobacteriota bacterium]